MSFSSHLFKACNSGRQRKIKGLCCTTNVVKVWQLIGQPAWVGVSASGRTRRPPPPTTPWLLLPQNRPISLSAVNQAPIFKMSLHVMFSLTIIRYSTVKYHDKGDNRLQSWNNELCRHQSKKNLPVKGLCSRC